MKSNQLNFGIGFLQGDKMQKTVGRVKKAEELGFTHCWIAEDYFFGGAFSTATACAANTTKINIGIGVINPFTRHPALTAMEFGAFDLVAEGRGILGMGTSNKRWIEEQMGIPFVKPLKTLNESIQIIKKLFSNGEVEFSGGIFNTGKIKLGFKPYKKDIPLFLGVKGPKALKLAGEIADGVLLSIMTSKDYVRYARGKIAEGAEESGRKLKDIKIAAYLVINISENRGKAREQVKPLIGKYLGIHGVHPILTSSGMAEEEILTFRKALLEGKDASNLVTDRLIDKFAIAGTKIECKEKIISIIETGIDYPVVFEVPGVSLEDSMKNISKLFIK